MKSIFFIKTILLLLPLFFISCSTTIKTTGFFKHDSEIKKISLLCISPKPAYKFSKKFCVNMNDKLNALGYASSINVLDEIDANQDYLLDSIKNTSDILLTISYKRITFFNGSCCSALMHLSLYQTDRHKPLWVANIETHDGWHADLMGIGNPKKISQIVIDHLKLDGF